jgi:hypothetical protein
MTDRPLIPLDIIGDYVSFPQTKSQTNEQEVVLRWSQWFGFSQSQEANVGLQPAVLILSIASGSGAFILNQSLPINPPTKS